MLDQVGGDVKVDERAERKQPLLGAARVSIRAAVEEVAVSAFPFALSDAILLSGAFINSAYLKKIAGNEGLAAGALANSTINLTYGFTISALYPVSLNIGQASEQQQHAQVGIIYRQGIVFAVILSIPAVGVLLLGGPVLRELNQPEEVVKIVEDFLQGFAIGYLPGLGYVVNQQLALGLKRPYSLVGAAVANTALIALFDYLFTLAELDISKAFGLGLANSLANTATFAVFTLYFTGKEFGQYFLFAGGWLKGELIKLMKMGLPIAIQVTAEFASLVGLSLMVGKQEDGVTALAAEQVSLLYLYILSIPTQISIAQAAGVAVGREFAAGRFANSQRYGNVALGFSVGISGICLIVVLGANRYLIKPFVDNDQALISTASDLLILNTATQILDAFRNITGGSLRGYNDFNAATFWGILGNTVIALPLAYVLGFHTNLNTLGMFAARTIGIGAAAAAMTYRWWNKSSNAGVTIEEIKSELPAPSSPKKGSSSWFECAGSFYNYLRGTPKPAAKPVVALPSTPLASARQTGPK